MVRAWYMDDDPSNPRFEHHKTPPEFLNIEELYKRTGVEYFQINPSTFETDGVLDEIKKKRGYTYEDELTCSKECLENYEEKLKIFYTEHLHTEEEIRFVMDGSAYWDVRDAQDRWVRIEVVAGDMLVLPSGSYHRLTLDTNDFLKVRRFFIGQPDWVAHNRVK